MSASTHSASVNQNHIEDQVYLGKLALKSESACALNLAGLAVLVGQKTPVSSLNYPLPSGAALSPDPIFVGRSGAVEMNEMSLEGDAHLGNVAHLNLGFKNSGGGLSAYHRRIPLEVELDAAGKIVRCTAGQLTNSGNSGGSNDLTAGACEAPLPSSGPRGDLKTPAETALRAERNKLCDVLSFPTSESTVLSSSQLDSLSTILGEPNPYAATSASGQLSLSRDLYLDTQNRLGPALVGLGSKAECQNAPILPSGSVFATGPPSKLGNGSVELTIVPAKACVGGVWVPSPILTTESMVSSG